MYVQREFRINKYLTLKLVGHNTELFVNDKSFIQCKQLILSIPREQKEQYSEIDSIDEAAEIYDHTIHDHEVLREGEAPEVENDENFSLISPEEEFWGHCSNLQVWVEHDYDTRLLKANLGFPLLKALAKAGDKRAEVRLKEEIIERVKSDYEPVIEYLYVEGYIDMLSNEELLYGLLIPEEAEILSELQTLLDIKFKFVPYLNWKKTLEFGDNIRKICIKGKNVVGIDLSFCDLNSLPISIEKLKKLSEIMLIGNNIDFNSKNSEYVLNNLEFLKILHLGSRKNTYNSLNKEVRIF